MPRQLSINQSLYLSDMTLQHMQLQQAEFGTGQTGHEVCLQLPKNKIYMKNRLLFTITESQSSIVLLT